MQSKTQIILTKIKFRQVHANDLENKEMQEKDSGKKLMFKQM